MTKNKNKKIRQRKQAFTLIEAMVVLFIVGILSATAAIGYGKANRMKMVEQAAQRISTEVSRLRDYSIYGQEVSNKFPCGYGVVISKGKSEIGEVYTSIIDRISAMGENKTCDELIENKDVQIAGISVGDPNDLSLKKVTVEKLTRVKDGASIDSDIGCLTLLFSAPRGVSYYCLSASSNCPPANCTFKVFSESGSLNSDLFLANLLIQEGNNSDRGYLRIYPSGNSELISE